MDAGNAPKERYRQPTTCGGIALEIFTSQECKFLSHTKLYIETSLHLLAFSVTPRFVPFWEAEPRGESVGLNNNLWWHSSQT
jgi:hypothetical protein